MRRLNRIAIIAATAVLGTFLGTANRAHADRFELSIGSETRMMPSSSMDALDADVMPMFSLTGAMAIDRVRVPFFDRFYVDTSFQVGGVDGTTFQTLDTNVSMISGAVGARLSRALSERWVLQTRAALGLARVGVSMSDMFVDGPALSDSGYTGIGQTSAGLDYLFARKRGKKGDRFAMGLRAEFGYLAMIPKTLHAQPDGSEHADGAILIPETAASLGDLNLSAWNLRVGLVGRF